MSGLSDETPPLEMRSPAKWQEFFQKADDSLTQLFIPLLSERLECERMYARMLEKWTQKCDKLFEKRDPNLDPMYDTITGFFKRLADDAGAQAALHNSIVNNAFVYNPQKHKQCWVLQELQQCVYKKKNEITEKKELEKAVKDMLDDYKAAYDRHILALDNIRSAKSVIDIYANRQKNLQDNYNSMKGDRSLDQDQLFEKKYLEERLRDNLMKINEAEQKYKKLALAEQENRDDFCANANFFDMSFKKKEIDRLSELYLLMSRFAKNLLLAEGVQRQDYLKTSENRLCDAMLLLDNADIRLEVEKLCLKQSSKVEFPQPVELFHGSGLKLISKTSVEQQTSTTSFRKQVRSTHGLGENKNRHNGASSMTDIEHFEAKNHQRNPRMEIDKRVTMRSHTCPRVTVVRHCSSTSTAGDTPVPAPRRISKLSHQTASKTSQSTEDQDDEDVVVLNAEELVHIKQQEAQKKTEMKSNGYLHSTKEWRRSTGPKSPRGGWDHLLEPAGQSGTNSRADEVTEVQVYAYRSRTPSPCSLEVFDNTCKRNACESVPQPCVAENSSFFHQIRHKLGSTAQSQSIKKGRRFRLIRDKPKPRSECGVNTEPAPRPCQGW